MNTKHLKDIAYLQMAYGMAEQAKGWASPNPLVGAVIVKGDTIIGFGYHKKPGQPHAEVVALQRAGLKAKNSTAYITLEPCIHWGRTPPCVNSILQAGIKRVVVSSLDPNPLVYRKGIQRLEQSGISVSVGLLAERNNRLNESYLKHITQKIPFVTVKAAVSADGKIATETHASRWITSGPTREYVHLLRGENDAIMVGINTILKDDPRLTVRHSNWSRKRITRVILDSTLRLPLHSRICDTLKHGEVIVFTNRQASPKKINALTKKGIRVIPLPQSRARINIKEALSWLGNHEISSVLVEGGGLLLTSIFEEKLADKIFLMRSPRLIGGKEAPTVFGGRGVATIKESLRLKRTHHFAIGSDTICEGYF
ncbi:MAG: bifunctional diaminohydroxyphosphoribosylaminopyrimidine deaminase/5-amino-6-(5-phosphoribosylamino)uracil reductase RibD [Candidatus Aminicenantes bacterium]|nr:bifunctional diaminohydroxyphosphoribosylaminopyrimidine deaminase/5-amino-6-(5-phosphoribosylamino)uracil reductase RibD [Candidatus Aminicenantes bacterium]